MKTKDIAARPRTTLGLVGASLALLLASACGGGGGLPGQAGASAPAQTDSGGAITVWVDPPRVPGGRGLQEGPPRDPDARSTRSTARSAARRCRSSSRSSTRPSRAGRTRSSSRPTTTSPGPPARRSTTPPT